MAVGKGYETVPTGGKNFQKHRKRWGGANVGSQNIIEKMVGKKSA